MVNQIKHTLQYLYRYSVKPISQFWLIYFVFIGLLLLSSIHNDIAFQFTGITSAPSMIFMIFFSLLTFKNVFPFVIKLGVSRKAYMLATFIYAFILSVLMSVLNYTYLYFFNLLADVFSIDRFEFIGLNMGEFVEMTFGNVYIFDFLLHLSFFLLFTFLGAFFYRFGIIYGTVLSSIFPLSMLIKSVGFKIVETLGYFSTFHENYTPISYLIVIAVCLVLNWFVVHRASALDQITKQN